MASSATNVNPQQGDKKGKDKTKDVMVLAEDRLADFTNFMSALMGRVGDMDKRIEELEYIGDIDELHGEMQATTSFMEAKFKREI